MKADITVVGFAVIDNGCWFKKLETNIRAK